MFGRSVRKQAFLLFDLGFRPADVATILQLKATNAYRYFQQWKKVPPLYQVKYKYIKRCFRKLSQRSRILLAELLAIELCTSAKQVLDQMRKPWAMKQIVTGEWKEWPVTRTHISGRGVVKKVLKEVVLSLKYPAEVKHILEIAINQDIKPTEGDLLI
jgi:hypothetical protein